MYVTYNTAYSQAYEYVCNEVYIEKLKLQCMSYVICTLYIRSIHSVESKLDQRIRSTLVNIRRYASMFTYNLVS